MYISKVGGQNLFGHVTVSALFTIQYTYTVKGWKLFFHTIWTVWVSKFAEFYASFKNITLPLCQNAAIKSYSKKPLL
jgi:hypothetical protein